MNNSTCTLLQALNDGATRLARAWADTHFHAPPHAKFDAQLLLAHVLEQPVSYLFAHGDALLTPNQQEMFFALIARRAQHEPVAYLLAKKSFFGRDFIVSPATLVPRPETELLVEQALTCIQEKSVVVDVGTGSGAIAISLALHAQVPIFAIDASQEALVIAEHNARALGASEYIQFLLGNLLLPFFPLLPRMRAAYSFDHLMVCANLPYLTSDQWETLDPTVRNFEPKHALIGGRTGLELYDELCMHLKAKKDVLPPHITLLCEIDPSQHERLPRMIAAHFPHAHIVVHHDAAHLPRLVLATLTLHSQP